MLKNTSISIPRSLLALAGMIGVLLAVSSPAHAQGSNPDSGYVSVNGMEMYYEISGEGDPLVVLHGAYMNIPSMGAIIPKLAETHTVYVLEFQGHGRTNDIARPITYPNLADDVAVFMDAVGLETADVFGYSMGAATGLQLAIRHPEKVRKLAAASVAYDEEGWQPALKAMIPQMSVDMFVGTPMEDAYRELSPDPDGFPALVEKLIALEHEPMAWEEDLQALETPILIIAGDADAVTLEHAVAMFRLLGGGGMGDMGEPLPASRLAVLPATSHTAVINQPDLLHAFIEPFLKGETPRGMFETDEEMPGTERDFSITRVIDAPVEEVWNAWSEPETVKRWWGPHGFTAPVAEIDFREGGTSLVAMSHPQFGDIYNTWTYTTIVPHERIEFVSHFADSNGNRISPTEAGIPGDVPFEVPHEITFKAMDDGRTEITVTEYGYTSNQTVEMSKAGQEQVLEKLAAIFEKD